MQPRSMLATHVLEQVAATTRRQASTAQHVRKPLAGSSTAFGLRALGSLICQAGLGQHPGRAVYGPGSEQLGQAQQ
ncbi:hypothetical protein D3C76_1688880 [compost metagenome]